MNIEALKWQVGFLSMEANENDWYIFYKVNESTEVVK